MPSPPPNDHGSPKNPDPGVGAASSGVEIAPGVRVPEGVLGWATSRASGPGGQNVNKRETRVQLRIALEAIPIPPLARARLKRAAGRMITDQGELLIASSQRRSQAGNRRACLERLRELIVRAQVQPKTRKKTRPTRGSIERRLKQKKSQSQKKDRRRWSDE